MKAYVGDFIQTGTHRHQGRVTMKESMYRGANGRAKKDKWFRAQSPRLPDSTLNDPWYHILCKGGGSVYVTESDIKAIVRPYDLKHPYWDEFYFGTETKKVRRAKLKDLPLMLNSLVSEDAKEELLRRLKGA